jgi:hypothetical protein
MIQTIFIIPYRNREHQKHFFDHYMTYLLEDTDPSTYEIVFAHQNNNLPFNRGALKNIGFLYAKEKYPNYKDIVFVFNDIDTLPYKKGLLDYTLQKNEIKHYYGFKFCLGGIFAIRGEDFERINGFPSFWYWGWEDTVIYERAISAHLYVNRSQYYEYGDTSILHLLDGVYKDVSMKTREMYNNKMVVDGLSTLSQIVYQKREMLDIESFTCSYSPEDNSVVQLKLKTKEKKENGKRKSTIPIRHAPSPFKMHYR